MENIQDNSSQDDIRIILFDCDGQSHNPLGSREPFRMLSRLSAIDCIRHFGHGHNWILCI